MHFHLFGSNEPRETNMILNGLSEVKRSLASNLSVRMNFQWTDDATIRYS